MRIKKLGTVLAVLLLATGVLAGCKSGEYDIPAYPDDIRMDIGAFFHPRADLEAQGLYDDAAAAGFNIMESRIHGENTDYTLDRTLQVLDYCEQAGIMLQVNDSTFRAGSDNYLLAYRDHPAFYGNSIWDEPFEEEFAHIKPIYDRFIALAPGKPGLVNLQPPANRTPANFAAYARQLMEDVGPSILSYDDYPLLVSKFGDGSVEMRPMYFMGLSAIAAVAKEYGVPKHSYILSVEHNGLYDYAKPTEESFRWLTACNMTYGFEKFTYFTYFTPEVPPTDVWQYKDAIIAADGTKTESYAYAKTVNQEILAWDHVYLRYNWEGTAYITADSDITNWMFEQVLDEGRMETDEIEGVRSITADADLLCGVFSDADGNRGFMLTGAANPYDGKTTVATVQFDSEYKGVQIYERGVPRTVKLNKGKAVITLSGGEGKFVLPLKYK